MELQMTNEERRLLDGVFNGNSSNRLYLHQKEALKQLRGVISWLAGKYPGIQMQYRVFEPLTKANECGFLFFERTGSDIPCKAMIRKADQEYRYTDTLYSELIQERYDAALTERLSVFADRVRTVTVFFTPAGFEINADSSVQTVLNHRPVLDRHTDIFASKDFEISEHMLSSLRDEGWFASYTVCITEDEALLFNGSFEQIRNTSEHLNFNVSAEEAGETR